MKTNISKRYFPRFILVLSFLFLSSSVCFAELDPNNPSNKYPVGGGRVLTQEEIAYNEAHKIYAVNDPRHSPQTPDQIAENNFAQQNMIKNERGDSEVRPKATGQRRVISSRLAVNENGQLEGIPDEKELAEHKKALEAIKAQNKKSLAEISLGTADVPEQQAQIQKELKASNDGVEKRVQDDIDKWEKDKRGETPKYESVGCIGEGCPDKKTNEPADGVGCIGSSK